MTETITVTYSVITYTLTSGAVALLELRATAGEVGIMTILTMYGLLGLIFRWAWKR